MGSSVALIRFSLLSSFLLMPAAFAEQKNPFFHVRRQFASASGVIRPEVGVPQASEAEPEPLFGKLPLPTIFKFAYRALEDSQFSTRADVAKVWDRDFRSITGKSVSEIFRGADLALGEHMTTNDRRKLIDLLKAAMAKSLKPEELKSIEANYPELDSIESYTKLGFMLPFRDPVRPAAGEVERWRKLKAEAAKAWSQEEFKRLMSQVPMDKLWPSVNQNDQIRESNDRILQWVALQVSQPGIDRRKLAPLARQLGVSLGTDLDAGPTDAERSALRKAASLLWSAKQREVSAAIGEWTSLMRQPGS